MISTTQAKQYLDQVCGITVPDFLVAAACEAVEAVEPAMLSAGYDEPTQIRVQSMAVALVAAGGDPRRIQSQGAASGASRSFKNRDGDLSALRRALLALDTAGTVSALIGPDPAAATLFAVTC